MTSNIIIKGIVNKLDVNTSERTFGAWASISVIDLQGDYIPIEEFKPALEKLSHSDRKIQIHDTHTNHACGEVLSYTFKKHPESGQEGLYITARIYNDYDSDTDIWNAILDKQYSGISLGGKAGSKTPVCDNNGCYNLLSNLELWEWSIVEKPANQYALIDSVNKLAKSYKTYKVHVKKSNPIEVNKDLEKEWLDGKIPWSQVQKGWLSDFGEYVEEDFVNRHFVPGQKPESDWSDKIKELWRKKQEEYDKGKFIHKAKVYVKNPSDAPKGVKVQEGKRGGHYYESNINNNKLISENNIDMAITLDENKYRKLIEKYPYGMYFYYLLNAPPLSGLDSIVNLNDKFNERKLILRNEQYKNKYNNTLEDIKLEMLGDAEKIKDIVLNFNNTGEIKLNDYIKRHINNIMLNNSDSKEIISITNKFYNTILNGEFGKLHDESMLAWEESSSSDLALLLKDSIKRQFGGDIKYHDAVKDIENKLNELHRKFPQETVDKYVQIQKKLTKAYLDVMFPNTDEIIIYRGTTQEETKNIGNDNEVFVQSNPLSSWTLKQDVAVNFASRGKEHYGKNRGIVLEMFVHKDDIWSTFMSHAYEGNEREILLIGNKDRKALVPWKF